MAHSTKLILCVLVAWATCVIANEIMSSDAKVSDKGKATGNKYSRQKREITKDIVGFNSEEKKAILDLHNKHRGVPRASNMLMMEWNSEIEKSAQRWSEQCKFFHSPNSPDRADLAGFKNVGENIFSSGGAFVPTLPVQLWYDEVKFYNYSTNGCIPFAVCGHYTQVVWADSKALGCGVKYCEKAERVSNGYIVVCQYGPTGNYVGAKPYKEGAACSECPPDRKLCVNGLCALPAEESAAGGSMQNLRPRSGLPFLFISLLWVVLRTAGL